MRSLANKMRLRAYLVCMALLNAVPLPGFAQTGGRASVEDCVLSRASKPEVFLTPGEAMRREAQNYYNTGGAAPLLPSAGFSEVGPEVMRILERGVAPCQLAMLQREIEANQDVALLLASANNESEAMNLMGAMTYYDHDISDILVGLANPYDNSINIANFASYANMAPSRVLSQSLR